jgi:hypothetical protein
MRRACAKRYPRSEPCDQYRTEGIRPGKGRLRAALTGRPGRQARVREAVPAVRAVRSESDGGDQRQVKGAGRACAKRYPRSGAPGRAI